MDPPLATEPVNVPDILNSTQPDTSNDDSVRIAAAALENMRSTPSQPLQLSNGTSFCHLKASQLRLCLSSFFPYFLTAYTASLDPADIEVGARRAGVIGQAMNLYDYSKANSRLVSYGAGVVESSVQAISRPVLDRLPNRVVRINPLSSLPTLVL